MSQKLILPINKMRLTSGYLNPNYAKEFGYKHYGIDVTDKDRKNYTIYASGKGTVTHTGWNNATGNTVVVVYLDCLCPDGKTRDIAMRYYHLKTIKVAVGKKVTKDTVLGLYGNTGFSTGAHLHLECDSDIKYPNYTPQIASKSANAVLKSGIASTVLNPVNVLWVKTSSPDYQSVCTSGYNTVASSDLKYKTTTIIY